MLNRSWSTLLPITILAAIFTFWLSGQAPSASDEPRFTTDNRLLRPDNYREWVWLSSGLGMSYGPHANVTAEKDPPFDNVFVTRAAYRSFLEKGQWPDKTMFVLELRSSVSKGSINQSGHFQTGLMGMEAEVKDESRFPAKWAFFDFSGSAKSATPIPRSATCYSCHARNGAVDNTFVQFYPTLLEIAKQKGTLKRVPAE
ncbi:MAG: cytochrome P460 family protein [Bryobacteraceae bacterium]